MNLTLGSVVPLAMFVIDLSLDGYNLPKTDNFSQLCYVWLSRTSTPPGTRWLRSLDLWQWGPTRG